MKKNDVFTFTAPNGVEVTGVILDTTGWYHDIDELWEREHLCYAQNRLFLGSEDYTCKDGKEELLDFTVTKVIVDYAILPDYDRMLEDYQHQIDMANNYADKTL